MQLIAENLGLIRADRFIFDRISFCVQKGEGLRISGPNGSGKTTLLRVIAGFMEAQEGHVSLSGVGKDAEIQEMCHYVGHLNGLKSSLTVAENLTFYAKFLKGAAIEPAIEAFHLTNIRHIPAGLLSAGQKRRLGLARLGVAPRPIWLLDEPTVSLDKTSTELLAGQMTEHLASGGIILAATHLPLGIDFTHSLDMQREGSVRT